MISVLVRTDFPITCKLSRGDVSPLETLVVSRGTNGSNPASSSGESCANRKSARGGAVVARLGCYGRSLAQLRHSSTFISIPAPATALAAGRRRGDSAAMPEAGFPGGQQL